MGRGLILKDISRSKKIYFEQICADLLNCKAFGGSRVKTRRCISRQEDFEQFELFNYLSKG